MLTAQNKSVIVTGPDLPSVWVWPCETIHLEEEGRGHVPVLLSSAIMAPLSMVQLCVGISDLWRS